MTIRRFRWEVVGCKTADEVHGKFLAAVIPPGKLPYGLSPKRLGYVQAGEMCWWQGGNGRGNGPVATASVVESGDRIEIVGKVEIGPQHYWPEFSAWPDFSTFSSREGGRFS
jgi:hypothetical protein